MNHHNVFESLVNDLITSGFSSDTHEYAKSKLILVNTFSCVGMTFLIIFGILHISLGNLLIGYSELGVASVVFINVITLRVLKNIALASRCVVLMSLTTLMLLFITGGLDQTGIFWFYVLPITALFLCGKKEGLIWVTILIIITLSVFFIGELGYLNLLYSAVTIRQLLLSILLVTLLTYFYQDTNEYNQKIIETRSEILLTSNKLLVEEIEKTKTQFVTLASHQLRTPITAIAWFTEMLLHEDAGKISDEQREQLNQIYLSNQRMAFLINNLLNVSQLELGNFSNTPQMTDVKKTAQIVLTDAIKEYMGDKKIIIKEEYDSTLPIISLDPYMLKIIFQNIFSNAIKYTASGTIIIKVSQSKSNSLPKTYINITVSDTGFGIPNNQQDKIFTKLFRAENIKSIDTDGSGLGLYMVKKIIDKIGGKISFVSAENKGTEMSISLPIKS